MHSSGQDEFKIELVLLPGGGNNIVFQVLEQKRDNWQFARAIGIHIVEFFLAKY